MKTIRLFFVLLVVGMSHPPLSQAVTNETSGEILMRLVREMQDGSQTKTNAVPLKSQIDASGAAQTVKHKPRPLTDAEARQVREHGLDPKGMMINASLPVLRAPKQQELEHFRQIGVDVDKLPPQLLFFADDEIAAMQQLIEKAEAAAGTSTPADLKNAMIYLSSFLGQKNATIAADVISAGADSLTFYCLGRTYNYSGHYTVVLRKAREHKNPYFGLGSPATANLLILEDVGGESMPLQNATIWEKDKGFIDVVAGGMEWIHSGPYAIQK